MLTQPSEDNPLLNGNTGVGFSQDIYSDREERVGHPIIGCRLGRDQSAKVERHMLDRKFAACATRQSCT